MISFSLISLSLPASAKNRGRDFFLIKNSLKRASYDSAPPCNVILATIHFGKAISKPFKIVV